jgi:hypothetical protein
MYARVVRFTAAIRFTELRGGLIRTFQSGTVGIARAGTAV